MTATLRIVPGKAIGPYWLGMSCLQLLEQLNLPVLGDRPYRMSSPHIATYDDTKLGIVIDVDIRIGLVYCITARNNYDVTTSSGLRIGTQVSEAVINDQAFRLDEVSGVLESQKEPGLFLELDDPDPLPNQILDLKVVGIGVNAPKTFLALELLKFDAEKADKIRREMLKIRGF